MENEELDLNADHEDDNGAGEGIEEPSLTDKIASLLDGNTEETPEAKPEAIIEPEAPALADDTKVTVKIAGVDTEVSLADLKSGYLRQSDYTQKTQALSQEKQQVQAAQQQFQSYLNSIPMLAQTASTNVHEAQAALYSPELMALAQSDPAEYVSQRAKIEATIAENTQAYHQMSQQYQEHQAQQQAAYQQQLQEVLVQSDKLLQAAIPEWNKPETKKAIADYATKAGFTTEEVSGLYDHRHVQILHKARLYDELVAKQGVTSKKIQAAPPRVLSSGASTEEAGNDFAARKAKAIKSGDQNALTKLMAEIL